MRYPWSKFYWDDFERDVRPLSLAARGAWISLLCVMSRAPRPGFLLYASGHPLSDSDIAKDLGIAESEWLSIRHELVEKTGVAKQDRQGTLYNSRMTREAEERSKDRLRKAEDCGKRDKYQSTQRKLPDKIRESSIEIPPKKPEARSQKPDTTATIVAVAVPAAPAAPAARLAELTPEEWAEPDPTVEAYSLVNRLMRVHPKPGNLQLAQQAAARVLAGAVNMRGVLADIEAKHEAWRQYWQADAKVFKPMLHRWFQDGDYLHPPALPRPNEGGEIQW